MKFTRLCSCALLTFSLVRPAWAGDKGWEATVFGGGHFTGHLNLESESGNDQLDVADGSSFGLAVGKDLAPDSAVEVMWTRQNSSLRSMGGGSPPEDLGSLTIDQYRFNGLYFPPQPEGRSRWFVLGGVGASVFSPEDSSGSITQFAFSLGGGVKIKLADHVGLRLDSRWSPTSFNTDNAIVCASSGAGGRCFVASSGQLLQQVEFTAGLFLRV